MGNPVSFRLRRLGYPVPRELGPAAQLPPKAKTGVEWARRPPAVISISPFSLATISEPPGGLQEP
jgi:hypothetical protein